MKYTFTFILCNEICTTSLHQGQIRHLPAADIKPVLGPGHGHVEEPAVLLLLGGEGGFAQAELDALRKLPFSTAVGLGPRVLRAETAPLAVLAAIHCRV